MVKTGLQQCLKGSPDSIIRKKTLIFSNSHGWVFSGLSIVSSFSSPREHSTSQFLLQLSVTIISGHYVVGGSDLSHFCARVLIAGVRPFSSLFFLLLKLAWIHSEWSPNIQMWKVCNVRKRSLFNQNAISSSSVPYAYEYIFLSRVKFCSLLKC